MGCRAHDHATKRGLLVLVARLCVVGIGIVTADSPRPDQTLHTWPSPRFDGPVKPQPTRALLGKSNVRHGKDSADLTLQRVYHNEQHHEKKHQRVLKFESYREAIELYFHLRGWWSPDDEAWHDREYRDKCPESTHPDGCLSCGKICRLLLHGKWVPGYEAVNEDRFASRGRYEDVCARIYVEEAESAARRPTRGARAEADPLRELERAQKRFRKLRPGGGYAGRAWFWGPGADKDRAQSLEVLYAHDIKLREDYVKTNKWIRTAHYGMDEETVLKDAVHYLLTRPEEAVPPKVRAMIATPGQRWPGAAPRWQLMPPMDKAREAGYDQVYTGQVEGIGFRGRGEVYVETDLQPWESWTSLIPPPPPPSPPPFVSNLTLHKYFEEDTTVLDTAVKVGLLSGAAIMAVLTMVFLYRWLVPEEEEQEAEPDPRMFQPEDRKMSRRPVFNPYAAEDDEAHAKEQVGKLLAERTEFVEHARAHSPFAALLPPLLPSKKTLRLAFESLLSRDPTRPRIRSRVTPQGALHHVVSGKAKYCQLE